VRWDAATADPRAVRRGPSARASRRVTPGTRGRGRAGRRPRHARAGRGRSLAPWAGLVVGLALVVAGAWWATNTHLFDLRRVSVEGTVHLSPDEVLRLAGLGEGTNVLWTPPGDVERRLERHPWVLDARVSRSLPSSLSITVREREPVARTRGPRPLLVASDGTVLGPAGEEWRLPTVSVPGDDLRAGARVSPHAPALTVARDLPPALRRAVGAVTADRTGRVTLELLDGTRVLFGSADDVKEKAASLQAVLSWARAAGLRPRTVDVRVPSAPALTPHAR
jgi:cell division protein FtsQ